MRAIVTVIGEDRVGIIATVTAALSEQKVNVLDITQTILGGYFTMIMLVETEDCPLPFVDLASLMANKGQETSLSIHMQREDIFQAMHRI